ncbi:myosin-like coiled-coil protein-domain-containing protein [Annulohypoxylon truncatum]|uniref:myosin-like coiled-coil protein-domain-containing protein n=1 Tax=Annulohypoxylon truncatum TaxID=327061 RepID=UPI0020085029|nr:myosin-like coiled-coil protein-domain-containing protein [Annulohypoxylon truncatum]KAI1214763.1 myosin-like coiled-coil protein-domain-containing protein [Annulohypoxylon truncatum]
MATTTHRGPSAAPAPLASAPNTNGNSAHAHVHDDSIPNGHHHVPVQEPRPAPTPTPSMASNAAIKKGKGKKALDQNEASKLISARISQLEVDTAAEKEQEAEIDREVRKANRELNHQMNKMNDMDKIELLTKRSSELFANMKRLERENLKNKKRADQLQKEKDSSRTDLSKQISLKEKLEKLCRELQKENNKLKNEHRTLGDTHDRLKTSSDERFRKVLETLEGYQEEKDNPRKQVVYMKAEELFKARFKSLIDQYELRELHFHSAMRTKEIEVQWNMARYEQQKKTAEAEANRARQLNSQVLTFSKTETELRNQLNVYVEKFKQVEDTLNNSNDLFLTFRKEMEDMSKKTKKLEKENETYKRKEGALNQNIFKMAEERNRNIKDLEDIKKKNDKLTSIINQMQQQGRGIPQGMQGTVESCYAEGAEGDEEGELEDGDEESDYEYDDEGDEEVSEEGEFDDDTEEEIMPQVPGAFGPERPPAMNGHR